METQTFEQALIEALNFAEDSYSENCDLHTIHNGLIHYNRSYVNKQVKIAQQLLDRLNEIASQYNLTDEQKGEINYYICEATQDVITYQAEWLRMYNASRRQEEQQLQLRRTRHEQNLNARRAERDRFMEEFRQAFGADNQEADDNANF